MQKVHKTGEVPQVKLIEEIFRVPEQWRAQAPCAQRVRVTAGVPQVGSLQDEQEATVLLANLLAEASDKDRKHVAKPCRRPAVVKHGGSWKGELSSELDVEAAVLLASLLSEIIAKKKEPTTKPGNLSLWVSL